jgi:hypothetical protein
MHRHPFGKPKRDPRTIVAAQAYRTTTSRIRYEARVTLRGRAQLYGSVGTVSGSMVTVHWDREPRIPGAGTTTRERAADLLVHSKKQSRGWVGSMAGWARRKGIL